MEALILCGSPPKGWGYSVFDDHLAIRIEVIVAIDNGSTIRTGQTVRLVDIPVADILDDLRSIGNIVEVTLILYQASVGCCSRTADVEVIADRTIQNLHLTISIKAVIAVSDWRAVRIGQAIRLVDIPVADILDDLRSIGNIVEVTLILYQASVGCCSRTADVEVIADRTIQNLHLTISIKTVIAVSDWRAVRIGQAIRLVDIPVADILDDLRSIGNIVEVTLILYQASVGCCSRTADVEVIADRTIQNFHLTISIKTVIAVSDWRAVRIGQAIRLVDIPVADILNDLRPSEI